MRTAQRLPMAPSPLGQPGQRTGMESLRMGEGEGNGVGSVGTVAVHGQGACDRYDDEWFYGSMKNAFGDDK